MIVRRPKGYARGAFRVQCVKLYITHNSKKNVFTYENRGSQDTCYKKYGVHQGREAFLALDAITVTHLASPIFTLGKKGHFLPLTTPCTIYKGEKIQSENCQTHALWASFSLSYFYFLFEKIEH